MDEKSKSERKIRREEILRKIDELLPGDRDAFLALSQGFAQTRQETDKAVRVIMSQLNTPSSLMEAKYVLTKEKLLAFRPSKYSELCHMMMDLLHDVAHIDVQNFKEVPAHVLAHFKEDRAAQAYEGLQNRVLLAIDHPDRQ